LSKIFTCQFRSTFMKVYHPEDHKLPNAFIEKLHCVAVLKLFYEFGRKICSFWLAFFVRAERT
jgi:hypothetical protein